MTQEQTNKLEQLWFLNKIVQLRCTVQCDGLISFALFASFQRKNWKAIRRRTEQKCLEGHCQFPFVLVISAALFLSSYQPQLSSTPLHNVRICQIHSDFMPNNAKKCYPIQKVERSNQNYPKVLVISAALFLSSTCHSSVQQQCTM